MISAGIDIGFEFTKAVILEDGKLIGRAKRHSGGIRRPENIIQVWNNALLDAGVSPSDVQAIGATGKGKHDAHFADSIIIEPVTSVAAAKCLCPKASTVVDIGSDEIVVATIKQGKIGEMTINQKCSAGLGYLMASVARRLGLPAEGFDDIPAECSVSVNDGCAPFAELGALELLSQGVDKREVMSAVINACAWRALSVINDITKQDTACVAVGGGVACNKAFIQALKRISGLNIVVMKEAEYAGAIGAAMEVLA